jgi:hypothetical protein
LRRFSTYLITVLLSLLTLFAVTGSASANHLTGSCTGPPISDSQNWVQAFNNLQPGDTLCLNQGNYGTGQAQDTLTASGVTIRPKDAFTGAAITTTHLVIRGNGDHLYRLSINGLESTTPLVTPTGDDIVLSRNVITNNHNGHSCINTFPRSTDDNTPDRLTVDANRIYSCGTYDNASGSFQGEGHGVYIESGTGHVITNNWIYDNTCRGVQLYWDDDRINQQDTTPPGALTNADVHNNVISDNMQGDENGTLGLSVDRICTHGIPSGNVSIGQASTGHNSGNAVHDNVVSYVYLYPTSNPTPNSGNYQLNTSLGENVSSDSFTNNCIYSPPPGTWYDLSDGTITIGTGNTQQDPQFTNHTYVVTGLRNYTVGNTACQDKDPAGTVGP